MCSENIQQIPFVTKWSCHIISFQNMQINRTSTQKYQKCFRTWTINVGYQKYSWNSSTIVLFFSVSDRMLSMCRFYRNEVICRKYDRNILSLLVFLNNIICGINGFTTSNQMLYHQISFYRPINTRSKYSNVHQEHPKSVA